MESSLLTPVLNTSVSIFRSKDSRDVRDVSIGAVLRAFKSEQYANTVKEARRMLNSGDEAGYKAKKGELPVVTFSGTFAGGHAKKNLKEYSNVVVLDIDDLAEEDLKRAQQCLAEDEFVFAYWKSPSNQGLKGLVRLEYSYEEDALNERHNNAFDQLEAHFLEHYGIALDSSGSDYSRLCFACWDSDLVLKAEAVPFAVQPPAKKESKKKAVGRPKAEAAEEKPILVGLKNLKGRNNPFKRREMESIIRYLKKKNKSITFHYSDWVKVAFAIVDTFNPDLGKKYFVQLSEMDAGKFDEAECLRMLDYCYRNSRGNITFATIVFKAKKLGYEKRGRVAY